MTHTIVVTPEARAFFTAGVPRTRGGFQSLKRMLAVRLAASETLHLSREELSVSCATPRTTVTGAINGNFVNSWASLLGAVRFARGLECPSAEPHVSHGGLQDAQLLVCGR
jgi:hypothetical protein